jgi:hypothetical protein
MKPILVVFLALILVACGTAPPPTAEQPTSAPPQPTQTPFVIVETVVVTVIPTNAQPDIPASDTPLPQPTEVPPTQPPAEPTQLATAAPTEDTSGDVITVDDSFGAGWFTNITRTRNDFSLRCPQNNEIAFSVVPSNPNIAQIDFYYRIEDRATGAIFDWQNAGRMIRQANGSFSLVFSGEKVNANFRKPNAWFDYQFIGSSGSGVVGRSEQIEQQVSYTFDCP